MMKKTLISSLMKESKEKRSQSEILRVEADAIDTVLGILGVVPAHTVTTHIHKVELNADKSPAKRRKYSDSRSNSYLNPRLDVLGESRNRIDYPKFILEYMSASNRTFCKTTDIYMKLTKKYGDADKNMYQKVLENMKVLKKKTAVEMKVVGNSYTWKLTDIGRKELAPVKLEKRKYAKRGKYNKKAKEAKKEISTKKVVAEKVGRSGIKVNGLTVNEIASQRSVSTRTIHRKLKSLIKEKKPLTDIFNTEKQEVTA